MFRLNAAAELGDVAYPPPDPAPTQRPPLLFRIYVASLKQSRVNCNLLLRV